MREFRPVVRPSKLRLALALVLPLVVILPLGALGALILGISQASYSIAGGELVVRSGEMFSGERTIPLASITEARPVMLHGGRRTAGTALPGFCAGRFSYPDLGTVWQVTTCSGRAVLIEAQNQPQPVVITPPDPADFVARLRAGTATEIVLPPPDKGPLRVIAMVVGPVTLLSILMVSALLLLGPGRMRYLVGDGALEVHTLFGKKRWPTAGARARAHTPEGILRVAGTGAPGYYTGIFREGGQSTRVYATDLSRVLLFEGEQRVILSPEDRVEMLRALEEEGVVVVHHA
jgi:hypothetical protein